MIRGGLAQGAINQVDPEPPLVFMIRALITTVRPFFKFHADCNIELFPHFSTFKRKHMEP